LIVDDNAFNQIPLEVFFTENIKTHVDKADNGVEAVALFRKNLEKTCCNVRYKLILMDLNMPVMDGFEASQRILQMQSDAI